MKVSILIPCYNEESSISLFFEELCSVLRQLKYYQFEMICIDDGSSDATLKIIEKLSLDDHRIKFISFSRNFGKESAIFAGLKYAAGDYICLMDADLQHPPKQIVHYLEAMEEGYDIAASRRITREGEKKIYSWFARRFYKVINRISNVDIEEGAQDFRMMKKKVVKAILNMPESHRFSKGIFSWVGFKTKWFEYRNVQRIAGTTKWSFNKSLSYAIDGIISFSTIPLRISFIIGFLFSIFGFVYAAYIVIKTIILGSDWPGFPTITSIILILGGTILSSLGVIGEYISKIYTEVKDRPIYIIDRTNIIGENIEDE
ncbi:MAG: glycosyltransferase family 2 protein [Eubacteriales bacterium]